MSPISSSGVDFTTRLGGFTAPNPIFTASGCAASGRELAQFFDLADLGGVVTKSVMLRPRAGRPTPRMAETASGMLNSIGLQGPGIDAFCDGDLPWLVAAGARPCVSIAGSSVEEYAELAHRLRSAPGISMLEVNISCPNVENRGEVFACDPGAASRVIRAVRAEIGSGVPMFAKLSPDITDIVAVARSCADAGATGLSMINTMLGLAIDLETMRPALGAVTGGLSGPAIKPVALRCVWQVHQAIPTVPILGMGGIMTGEDALAFILAGASAVSVGTAIFHDPSAPMRIGRELGRALRSRGFTTLAAAIGHAHRGADTQPVADEPTSVQDFPWASADPEGEGAVLDKSRSEANVDERA